VTGYGLSFGGLGQLSPRIPRVSWRTQWRARTVDGSTAILTARQLLPLPQTEDYLVRRRRKEQEEERVRGTVAEWTWEMYEAAYPAEHVAIARELFKRMQSYVAEHDLPWTEALRSGWLGFQRPGDYYVTGMSLQKTRPVEFWIKIPDDPAALGLESPYPELSSRWDGRDRQWGWLVPSLDQIPDVTPAIEISRPFQPVSGPMPPPVAVAGGAADSS
jgi:hypothetical protein